MRHPARPLPLTGGASAWVAVVAILMPAAAAEPDKTAGPLLWPLRNPGIVVSSFGEYRYDRMHAGVDISTGGGTGLPVLAADDGEIFRLKVQWRGYGRALYVRHAAGRITVYAHLERFEDVRLRLERSVAQRQAEVGSRFPGDIDLEPPVRIERGQVIAFSGESGNGLPHLHFEVRQGDRPIDPFRAGLAPPADRRSPVLEALTITAAAGSTFVDGVLRERDYPLVGRRGSYAARDAVRVTGPFLAGLTAHDPAGGARAGLRAVEAAVDGVTRYRLDLETFRFDQNPVAGLIYDHRRSRLNPPRYSYRLFRLPGNALAGPPTAEAGPAAGGAATMAFDLAPGAHRLTVTATDAAGNESRATACVLVARPSAPRVIDDRAEPPRGGLSRVRFEQEPAAAPPVEAGRAAPGPACAPGGLAVQGEIWPGDDGRFRPVSCSAGEGICRWGRGAAGDPARVLRLREVRDGVPGSWTILPVADPGGTAAPDLPGLRVEAYPDFLDVILPVDRPLPGRFTLRSGAGGAGSIPFRYRDGLLYGAPLPYAAGGGTPIVVAAGDGEDAAGIAGLPVETCYAPRGAAVDCRGPGHVVRLPAGSRFYTGALVLRHREVAPIEGLEPLGVAVEMLPEGEALEVPGLLTFDAAGAPGATAALGIYRWDDFRGRWQHEGGGIDGNGGSMTLKFSRYGEFALLRDLSPPVITEVRPGPGARGVARSPAIQARLREIGEGLNHDGVAFVLDGAALEAEFDPDRALARVLSPPRLAPGRHRLSVVATDLAGNVSTPVEIVFVVR